ncbi:MAG: hypothetical protein WCY89_02945 [Flavobacteriaceae bacterium]
MKNFLRKISVFIGGLFLIILIIFGVNRYFSDFRILPENTILIMGHSHSECAYNDSLILGVANYSDSGETYFYNYIKLRQLIKQNPKINKVLIEFTNNQIESFIDERTWEDKYISHRFPKYGVFMDKEEMALLLKKNPTYFKENLSACFKSNFMMILKNQLNYTTEIGGYKYLERKLTETEQEEDTTEKVDNETLAVYNLYYLDKIIAFCQQNNVEVILIRSPLHKDYNFDNEAVFQNMLKTKYHELDFLDFSEFPLSDDEFGDVLHLNHKGAKKYSLWFDRLLKKGLFQKNHKQKFIDKEIETLNIEL